MNSLTDQSIGISGIVSGAVDALLKDDDSFQPLEAVDDHQKAIHPEPLGGEMHHPSKSASSTNPLQPSKSRRSVMQPSTSTSHEEDRPPPVKRRRIQISPVPIHDPTPPAAINRMTASGSATATAKPSSATNVPNTVSTLRQLTITPTGGLGPPVKDSDDVLDGINGDDEPYRIEYKGSRSFKNSAHEITYEVKFNDNWIGRNFATLQDELLVMFRKILANARKHDKDLGKVVVFPDGMDPIVIPLMEWDRMTESEILQHIEKVAQSQTSIPITSTFRIQLGIIQLPKGSKRLRITRLRGPGNSIERKRSMVAIVNTDTLCMARSIAVSWASKFKDENDNWSRITNGRDVQGDVRFQLAVRHGCFPKSQYVNLTNKTRNIQGDFARWLHKQADIEIGPRPCTVRDVPLFEAVLNVKIHVVSAMEGNKIITTSDPDDQRQCIFIYHSQEDGEDVGHFDAITKINGFFSSRHYCTVCLVGYNDDHRCPKSCAKCKRRDCPSGDDENILCRECNRQFRNDDCFNFHKEKRIITRGPKKGEQGSSLCEKYWQCTVCHKTIQRNLRDPQEHICYEYQCRLCQLWCPPTDQHYCYMRAADKPAPTKHVKKWLFFDFETTQDKTKACEEGYSPLPIPGCDNCLPTHTCSKCSKCKNCDKSWCGMPEHRVNYCISLKTCENCMNDEIQPESRCSVCGNRCKKCKDTASPPCPATCGRREMIFKGSNTLTDFGQYLFSEQHSNIIALAHNNSAFDGHFLIQYLVTQSITPDVLYNGAKIMQIRVARGLNITVLDSYLFMPIRLAKLPSAFGVVNLEKGNIMTIYNTIC